MFKGFKRSTTTLCAAILAFAGIIATAAPHKAGAVKLVTGNNYFPYTDERLPGGGLGTLIVAAVFQHMRIDTNFSFEAWGDGYEAARQGRYLATFPYIKTPEREANFLYSDELFVVRPQIFMNFDKAPELTQPSDLAGMILCLPQGWSVDAYLKPAVDSGQLRVYNKTNVLGCFKLLHQGKVQAISIDRRLGTAAANAVSQAPWTRTRRLSIDSSPNHLIISRSIPGAQGWIDRFNASLAILRGDGTIARITRDFFDRYE